MTPEISIVIPAFNEALRLPATLDRVEQYLATAGLPTEVLVVDDGSHDATAAVVRERAARWPQLKLLTAERNGGKRGRGAPRDGGRRGALPGLSATPI